MKRIFKLVLSLALVVGITGCGQNEAKDSDTLKLGVVGERNEPWEDAIEKYKEDTGKDVELVIFNDYNQPNDALKDGDIALSSFATKIFIEDYNQNQDAGFVYIGDTIISPMGIYSNSLKDYKNVPENGKVAIPVEVSNNSRALYILDAAGLIKVREDAGDFVTIDDIKENPKNLEFMEFPADQVSRNLDDVDLALINADMAMEASLNPKKDAIYLEDPNHERSKNFINVIAVKEKNKDNEDIRNLVDNYYFTDQTKKVIEDEFKGSVIPVW